MQLHIRVDDAALVKLTGLTVEQIRAGIASLNGRARSVNAGTATAVAGVAGPVNARSGHTDYRLLVVPIVVVAVGRVLRPVVKAALRGRRLRVALCGLADPVGGLVIHRC